MSNSDTKTQHASAEGDHVKFIPLIGNRELILALGYTSASAFRQALSREQLPINVFSIPNRRGKFALRADLLRWVETLNNSRFEQQVEKECH